jgi:tRNA pseudouridine38-40 synthase
VKDLDVDLLQQAGALLLGNHSFKAFAKSGQEHRGDRSIVSEAVWVGWERIGLAFHITANRFLHHMVRYLVGTMVDVGLGRRPLAELEALLSDPDTKHVTSAPAPSEGLFLTKVHYPDPLPAGPSGDPESAFPPDSPGRRPEDDDEEG